MTVQILTHFDAKFKPVADLTYPVLKEYGERHNYFVWACEQRNSDRHPVWDKIPLIRENLKAADWTMYVDADALVTNLTLPLDDVLDTDKDFIVAHDVNGLNAGVMFFRNASWTQEFLRRIWEIDPNHGIYSRGRGSWNETEGEQNAIKGTIEDSEDRDEHIKYVNQKRINAYLYHLYGYPYGQDGAWREGDFVLHLPGMKNDDRVRIFQSHLGQIKR